MARKPTRFEGFGPDAASFLHDLATHNERPWFMANKPVYGRELVQPFKLLLAELISILAEREIPLTGDPAKSIFRIHRDVRFSHNKLPYKTNAGAVLTRDGAKGGSGVLYIHFDPEGCFVASGFYHPEREALGALREAIYTEPGTFTDLKATLAKAGLHFDDSESLIRMPRGFEDAAEMDIAPALRLKSYVIRRPIADAHWASRSLVGEIADFAQSALPLLQFGWHALSVLDPTALTRQK